MSDARLPSSAYEQFLDALKDHPPFSPRDETTNSVARMIALQGDRQVAEKLSNLCASNDPASLRLLAHFGNLSRFSAEIPNDPASKARYYETFQMEPFPERGFRWAFDFFMRDMPIRPSAHHWRLAVLFYLNLNSCSHLYNIQRALDILLIPVSQGMSIPVSTFHVILNHIALERPRNQKFKENPEKQLELEVVSRLKIMCKIIKDMKSDFGYDYRYDEEIYLALYKACCQPFPNINELISNIKEPLIHHPPEWYKLIVKFYYEHFLPISPEFLLLELMLFAHKHRWRSFLKRWTWTKEAGIERDIDLWTAFWGLLARGQNEYYIRIALRDHFPELFEGRFEVASCKRIGTALARCLELVDPHEREFETHRRQMQRICESLE